MAEAKALDPNSADFLAREFEIWDLLREELGGMKGVSSL